MLYSITLGPTDVLSIPREIFRSSTPPAVWEARAEQVKQAFVHAYHGYEEHAAPHDELLPATAGSVDNFNGWGVSVYDSLDTMLLMGLDDEFKRALPIIARTNFTSVTPSEYVPFFETVIRYLGGLLSAYAMSRERMLLDRAEDLTTSLAAAFDSKSGLPLYSVSPSARRGKGSEIGVLAEIASCQLEYSYLAKLTGKKEHLDHAYTIVRALEHSDVSKTGGMLPTRWNVTSGQPWQSVLQVSVGAAADSAHEYLLKQYLMEARHDKGSLELYLRTTNYIITNLLYLSPTRRLLYVTDLQGNNQNPSRVFEHLSCFLPGLFALGAYSLPLDRLSDLGISTSSIIAGLPSELRQKYFTLLTKYNLRDLHFWVAEGLAQTCWLTYADQKSGLGPDEVVMDAVPRKGSETFRDSTHGREGDWGAGRWYDAVEKWRKSGARGAPPGTADRPPVVYDDYENGNGPREGHARDYATRKTEYLLRPETIESLYLMWRTTGDERWRDRAWAIFEAIERETKTETGYTIIKAVHRDPPTRGNSMPSYFLAETLKYLYLAFNNEDLVPLDKWVFNTEAHPFPVFNWTVAERKKFGLS
ncbi:glycoside hydrolase family 47 protein [Gloeophyllum trabeum ATCC 11539]|uniref:alpha-1,2-Mannosidase n=1 Tax=Gloeophyllum trabeum (strain ATCC 11539 / FP-39264 / Madison 617) TaxID=670483 RepID=S7QBB9_GLOTA|nr:glycoside hydrolase family 47 protein [Gloeophyllum trabeum ATCC 11539]EPQ56632.1 glycoside hydrolase family 47 protein [Gloeophyllum trabeum ATCC 11539]